MAVVRVYDAERVQCMNDLLARNWWVMALRGAAAIVLGFLAFMMPGVTVATLAIMLAAYLLADGVLAIIAGIRAARAQERWLPFVLEGIAGLIAGGLAVLWPKATLFALVFLVAVWSVVTGFAEIMSAWRMHRSHGKWAWGIAGALSVVFGFGVWAVPALGLLALAWSVASYLIAFGVLTLVTAFRLRRCHHDHSHSDHGTAVPAE
ncbi:HdeD family acid-resistance protein [Azospirillum sp. sgz302134]